MGERDWTDQMAEAVAATNIKVVGEVPSWSLAQSYLSAAQASMMLMATQLEAYQRLTVARDIAFLGALGLGGGTPTIRDNVRDKVEDRAGGSSDVRESRTHIERRLDRLPGEPVVT